jgi:hypothetical protein
MSRQSHCTLCHAPRYGDSATQAIVLDRCTRLRYRAAMHRSAGTPTQYAKNHGPAAVRWFSYAYFYGYVPPALLAGREAASR